MNINRRIYTKVPLLSLLVVGFVGAMVMYWLLYQLTSTNPNSFQPNDLSVYFQSSRWVVGQGTLYKDVFSEYPLLPNLIFGCFRFLAELFHHFSSSFHSFAWLWISASWFLYLGILYFIFTRLSKEGIWIWLGLAPFYFALLRFDIYPATAVILALFFIRSKKYIHGACWLGIAIALKGYALFILPAYFVFLYYKKGLRFAFVTTALCLAPFFFSQIVVFAYSGLEGLKQPYSFHLQRNLNGESTYDAILFLFPFPLLRELLNSLAKWLQIAMSILAAGLKPKSFEDLVNSFLLGILGFISFSVFYSPQFLLWIISISCFSQNHFLNLLAITFSWATFIYFPVLYGDSSIHISENIPYAPLLFRTMIILITAIRLAMIYEILKNFKTLKVQ